MPPSTRLTATGEWPGPKKLGRYECDERLGGEGGLETYRARVRGLAGFDRLFAVKLLRFKRSDNAIALTDAFTKAAKRSASIDEPRIARVVDTDTADGMVFAVTEFIRGLDLAQFREQARAASVLATGSSEEAKHWYELVAYLGAEVARGLAAVHGLSSPWAHGGLCPGNVFVNVRGGIKLLDFGMRSAASRPGEPRAKRLAPYSAPELVNGSDASPEADAFALGAILCELVTDQLPPQSGRAADVESALAEVPDQLATVIAQLLSHEPSDRPLAAAAADALASAYEGATEGALVTTLVSLIRRFSEAAAQAAPEKQAVSAEVAMPQPQPPTRPSARFSSIGAPPLEGAADSLDGEGAGEPNASASGEFTAISDERTNAAEPELLASLVARSRPTDALRVPTAAADSPPAAVPVSVPKPAPRNPTMIAFGNQARAPMATMLGGPPRPLPSPAGGPTVRQPGTLPRLSPLKTPPAAPIEAAAPAPAAPTAQTESVQNAFLLDEADGASAPEPELALQASPANWGARALAALGGQAGLGPGPAVGEPKLEDALDGVDLPPSFEAAAASFGDLPTLDEPSLVEEPPKLKRDRSTPSFSDLPAIDESAFAPGPVSKGIPESFSDLPAVRDSDSAVDPSLDEGAAAASPNETPTLVPSGFAVDSPPATEAPGFIMDSVEEPTPALAGKTERQPDQTLEAQAYEDQSLEAQAYGDQGLEEQAYADVSVETAAPAVARDGLLEDELVDGPGTAAGESTAPEAAPPFTHNDAFAQTLALNPEAAAAALASAPEPAPSPRPPEPARPATPPPTTPKPRLATVRRTARLDADAEWGEAPGAAKRRRWLLVGAVLGLTVVGGGALAGYLAGTRKKPPVVAQADRPTKRQTATSKPAAPLAEAKPAPIPAKPEAKPAPIPAKPEAKLTAKPAPAAAAETIKPAAPAKATPVVAALAQKAAPAAAAETIKPAAPAKAMPVVAAVAQKAAPVPPSPVSEKKPTAAAPAAVEKKPAPVEQKPAASAAAVARGQDDRAGSGALVAVTVNSSPDGAAVWINGQERGRTPLSVKIKSGAARVVLVKAGFLSATADVQASEGSSVSKTLQAVQPPMEGEARFRAECTSAGKLPIVVDGKETGILCPFTKMRVSPGIHRIGLFIPALGTVHEKEVHLPAGVRSVVFTD